MDTALTRITDQAAQIERQRSRIAALEAFVEEVATAKPEIISGKHPGDRSGQSDMPDMIEADWFTTFQDDAKRLLDVTPREIFGVPV